jgi:hypothetical protein
LYVHISCGNMYTLSYPHPSNYLLCSWFNLSIFEVLLWCPLTLFLQYKFTCLSASWAAACCTGLWMEFLTFVTLRPCRIGLHTICPEFLLHCRLVCFEYENVCIYSLNIFSTNIY